MSDHSEYMPTKVDETIKLIISDLVAHALENAANSVQKVLSVSSNFLSSSTHDALTGFHDLYSNQSSEMDSRKDQANRSVDALIDQLQNGTAEINEGTEDSDNRLGLSGLQKKLEAIISLENDVRDKLAPILSGMQFEDATRQRLDHIVCGLKKIFAALGPNFEAQVETISREIAEVLSSNAEREIYYKIVLDEAPPEGFEQQSIWLDFN